LGGFMVSCFEGFVPENRRIPRTGCFGRPWRRVLTNTLGGAGGRVPRSARRMGVLDPGTKLVASTGGQGRFGGGLCRRQGASEQHTGYKGRAGPEGEQGDNGKRGTPAVGFL